MRRTNLAGHALRSEGKPYELAASGPDEWVRSDDSSSGVALCECGTASGWLTSDAARKCWHRDVHKPEIREAITRALTGEDGTDEH